MVCLYVWETKMLDIVKKNSKSQDREKLEAEERAESLKK